jgi:UDP-4-amino-4,6-dideoxy-N-acetyl-beta-L-altrosamine transaminase
MNVKVIPYGKQFISEEDINVVVETLNSDFLTQGPKITEFEEKFASYVEAKYAVAVSNGTAALHLSALALGVSSGDKVITTPLTFAASANCIKYCGGDLVFADIDSDTYLIDLDKVEEILASSPYGTYKGIIPVDFSGRPVDLCRLREIADKYGCWILEDSCHSPGGYFIDKYGVKQSCGNGNYAELAIFSFHPVKHIATGEGGMITTNDTNLYKKLLKLRTHGITRDPIEFQNSIELAGGKGEYPGWYMEMQQLGYNYRLTDFQSALGVSQLKRADIGLQRRKEIAFKYKEAFRGKEYIKGQSGYDENNAYHLYIIEVENRLELYNYLRNNNVYAQVHYIPLHLMPYYSKQGWKVGDLPKAESYYKKCLSLPVYPTLSNQEQAFVIKLINDFFNV